MKRSLKLSVSIIALMASGFCLDAQDFAVTTRGDTLQGKIKVFSFGPDKKIQVTGADKTKKTLSILQLAGFKLDDQVYSTVRGPLGYQFMKLIKDGYLSLYSFQLRDQMTFDGLLLVKKDGTFMEVPNLTFKKSMKNFLGECPATVAKLDNDSFERRDLHEIVDHYNACVTQTNQAVADSEKKREIVSKKKNVWETLEAAVSAKPDFAGKADALEMIGEVKSKLSRNEKVPNFLVEGLKGSLKDAGVDQELSAALEEIK